MALAVNTIDIRSPNNKIRTLPVTNKKEDKMTAKIIRIANTMMLLSFNAWMTKCLKESNDGKFMPSSKSFITNVLECIAATYIFFFKKIIKN